MCRARLFGGKYGILVEMRLAEVVRDAIEKEMLPGHSGRAKRAIRFKPSCLPRSADTFVRGMHRLTRQKREGSQNERTSSVFIKYRPPIGVMCVPIKYRPPIGDIGGHCRV